MLFIVKYFVLPVLKYCKLPLCQIYLLYFLIFIDRNSFNCFYRSITVFYCIIESFFYLFTIEEAKLLNNRPLPKRALLPDNYNEQFVDRILNVYEKFEDDFRICFAGWLNGINNSSLNLIYEENILEYIAMATYGLKYSDDMTDEQQQHIKHLYNRYFEKYPQQRSNIKSGYNHQIQLKHPYRDLIRYRHYPMLKYILFACVRCIIMMIIRSMGYQYQVIDGAEFYVRKYSKKTSLSPILFLHGLSFGVNSYILFIRRLTSLDRTIILLDIPHASMRLHTEIFSMSKILSSIEKLLISLNEKHVVSIGHSYGTFIQSCIIKQLSHLVYDQVVIFIDPVCFLIFDSRYMNNFIYRKPLTPNQLLLYTSCTEDLYLMYAIERHLCWYESNLWAEDIKQKYLKKSNINTTVFLQFKHAQFLITPKVQDYVLETLCQLEAEKPSIENNKSEKF